MITRLWLESGMITDASEFVHQGQPRVDLLLGHADPARRGREDRKAQRHINLSRLRNHMRLDFTEEGGGRLR